MITAVYDRLKGGLDYKGVNKQIITYLLTQITSWEYEQVFIHCSYFS